MGFIWTKGGVTCDKPHCSVTCPSPCFNPDPQLWPSSSSIPRAAGLTQRGHPLLVPLSFLEIPYPSIPALQSQMPIRSQPAASNSSFFSLCCIYLHRGISLWLTMKWFAVWTGWNSFVLLFRCSPAVLQCFSSLWTSSTSNWQESDGFSILSPNNLGLKPFSPIWHVNISLWHFPPCRQNLHSQGVFLEAYG